MPKWPAYLMAAAAAACAYPALTSPPPPEAEHYALGQDRVLTVEDGRIDLAADPGLAPAALASVD